MNKPVALLGFMGSGKSVVGALVAERTKAPFHDLDRMIEEEAGMPIREIFAASLADDRLGIPMSRDGERIRYAYPVAVLVADKSAA